MTRHRLPIAKLRPAWTSGESNDCLISVGEEVYTARALALSWGAESYYSCRQLLAAGDKMRDKMDNVLLTVKARSSAGERALRKYWEAKSCARRQAERHP